MFCEPQRFVSVFSVLLWTVDVGDVVLVVGGRAEDATDADGAWSAFLHESVGEWMPVHPRPTCDTSRPQARQHAHQWRHAGQDRWLRPRDKDWVPRREEDVSWTWLMNRVDSDVFQSWLMFTEGWSTPFLFISRFIVKIKSSHQIVDGDVQICYCVSFWHCSKF